MPARQDASKFFPFRYGSPGMVFTEREMDGDDPAVDQFGLSERIGGSFIDIQLDDAAILALAAAPQQLVAAPGANRAIIVDAVYMFFDLGLGAYDDAAGDGDLNLIYAGEADASAGFNIQADAFIDAVADAARFFAHAHDYVAGAAIVVTPVANVAVQLDNDGAEFTSVGNDTSTNTLSIRVYYHIVDVAAFT